VENERGSGERGEGGEPVTKWGENCSPVSKRQVSEIKKGEKDDWWVLRVQVREPHLDDGLSPFHCCSKRRSAFLARSGRGGEQKQEETILAFEKKVTFKEGLTSQSANAAAQKTDHNGLHLFADRGGGENAGFPIQGPLLNGRAVLKGSENLRFGKTL